MRTRLLLAPILALSLVAPPATARVAVAAARALPGVIFCAGGYCLLEHADGRRQRVVIGRLPQETQRHLTLRCPVTRGCVARVSGVVDPFGALQARRAVLVSDV